MTKLLSFAQVVNRVCDKSQLKLGLGTDRSQILQPLVTFCLQTGVAQRTKPFIQPNESS